MIRLSTSEPGFAQAFRDLVDARREADADVARDVRTIVASVRDEGDAALHAFTSKFDRHDLNDTGWRIEKADCAAALDALEPKLRDALRLAADRITAYHEKQKPADSDEYVEEHHPRRSFLRSLKAGGSAIDLAFRAPSVRHPPVVALCDISGSMSEYTRIFLHFLHALGERRRVSTFLFGTRLTNVTRALREKDVDEALALCSDQVKDWSGGTRIGAALHRFNREWSRRALGQGAIVLLFTDGLERDETQELGREMERLRKSCRRLVWAKPLLRYGGFEAKALGIRAMLPH